jgi:sugar/nucleoside kinase (ribokinase family)
MAQIDYLAIGHVTKDLTPAGEMLGGSVSFAARVAQALGCRTAVLSRSAPHFPWQPELDGIQTCLIPSDQTTTFENVYTPQGRRQTLHAVAGPIQAAHLAQAPAGWQRAHIAHFAPVANEIDTDLIHLFSNSLVCLTPQGWLRRWGEDGRVYPAAWPEARQILSLAAAAVFSLEDFPDEATLAQYREWSRLLVVTRGSGGCTVYLGDECRDVPASPAREVETTGAGDIFAASFFVRLHQTGGNPWEAARFANDIAARSVEVAGLAAKLDAIQKQTTQ